MFRMVYHHDKAIKLTLWLLRILSTYLFRHATQIIEIIAIRIPTIERPEKTTRIKMPREFTA